MFYRTVAGQQIVFVFFDSEYRNFFFVYNIIDSIIRLICNGWCLDASLLVQQCQTVMNYRLVKLSMKIHLIRFFFTHSFYSRTTYMNQNELKSIDYFSNIKKPFNRIHHLCNQYMCNQQFHQLFKKNARFSVHKVHREEM